MNNYQSVLIILSGILCTFTGAFMMEPNTFNSGACIINGSILIAFGANEFKL